MFACYKSFSYTLLDFLAFDLLLIIGKQSHPLDLIMCDRGLPSCHSLIMTACVCSLSEISAKPMPLVCFSIDDVSLCLSEFIDVTVLLLIKVELGLGVNCFAVNMLPVSKKETADSYKFIDETVLLLIKAELRLGVNDTKPYIKLRSLRSVHWDHQVVSEPRGSRSRIYKVLELKKATLCFAVNMLPVSNKETTGSYKVVTAAIGRG
ncbi:hypothetical protein Tco_1047233 [Tanacetum coccineum]